MTKSITYYKMLILCPSDVVDFLDEIQKTVLSFNLGFGRQNGFFIETKHWPNDNFCRKPICCLAFLRQALERQLKNAD